jgi:cytochrome c oxidase cbb3-type subunit 2
MNRVVFLYTGVLFSVLASFAGLVAVPKLQLAALEPVVDDQGRSYPIEPSGLVAEGRAVYVSLGCLYCHSQQVRPPGFGVDIDRGWGVRRTVARDHLFDAPPLFGTMRTGPDLANIGVRQPSDGWHLLHLFQPRATSPGSTMPPYPFLFESRTIMVEIPGDALQLPPEWEQEGRAVVPTRQAKALVAYLGSLNASHPLPEVK